MGLQQISVGLVILSGGVFILAQAGLLAVLWHRRRQAAAAGVPLGVEAVWTLVPALLLVLLLLVAGSRAGLQAAPVTAAATEPAGAGR